MNFLRAYRLPIAWMLFAFVLFNGLACSIGHGLMMGMARAPEQAMRPAASAAPADAHAGVQMDRSMPMPMHSAHGADRQARHDSLKSMFGDCSFAGILAVAMLCFAALGWLTRMRQPPFVLYQRWPGLSFRLFFPALNPRAP